MPAAETPYSSMAIPAISYRSDDRVYDLAGPQSGKLLNGQERTDVTMLTSTVNNTTSFSQHSDQLLALRMFLMSKLFTCFEIMRMFHRIVQMNG